MSQPTPADLRRFSLWAELSSPEMAQITPLFERKKYGPGHIFYEEGALPDAFYLVEQGLVLLAEGDIPAERRVLLQVGPGEAFGAGGLLENRPRKMTAEALQETTCLVIDQAEFEYLIRRFPTFLLRLEASLRPGERRPMPRFPWQQPGEVVVAHGLRHGWLLVVRGAIPVGLALLLSTLLLFIAFQWVPAAILPAGVFVLVFLGLVILWVVGSWRSDTLVVTDRRVVREEKDLSPRRFLRQTRHEVILDRIQDVMISQNSFLARTLNFGDLTIETSGTAGQLVFRGIEDPRAWKELIFALHQRASIQFREETRRAIQEELRKGWIQAEPPVSTQPPSPVSALSDNPTLNLFWWLSPILKLWPKTWLFEGDVITWRKHWFALLRSIVPPVVGICVSSVLAFFLTWNSLLSSNIILPGYGVAMLIFLGWLVWEFEDWRNDLYQLTSTRLIDLERRPFFLGERRQEASLGNVQDMRVIIPGIAGHLFRYGTVVIETAGERGQLIFEWVTDPRRVQAEIARRAEAYRKQQTALAAQQRRQELLDWFAAYDELRRETPDREQAIVDESDVNTPPDGPKSR